MYSSQILKREMILWELDMIGNINDFMNIVNQFRQNPSQILSQRFSIPQEINMNNPNDIIQHLLNTGQISQMQVNNMMQTMNNPIIKQFYNSRKV